MTKQFKLTVKGQVTIPKDVRDVLGLKPGDPVAFDRAGDDVILRKGEAETLQESESFEERLERALRLYPAHDLGMTPDDYMALIRDPVELPIAS